MKKSKVLVAAIALLGFSTAASITGTVAWFTANNIVSATGMSIKAEAEEGIVIAEELSSYSDASWKTNVTAAHTGSGLDKGFIPTSTSTAAAWYHGNSESADDYHAGSDENALQAITVAAPTAISGNGVGTATVNGITGRNVYLLNHFYVQSTVPGAGILNQDLEIKNVTAQDSSTDEKALTLDKSLRVLFKLGDTVKIYCPLLEADFEAEEYAGAAEYVNGVDATPDLLLSNSTIPGYVANSNSSALDVSVYVYFEGQDSNCMSANIGSFANIAISFKLGNKLHQ